MTLININQFEESGEYEAASRIEEILTRLGLDNSPEQPMATLSGGEKNYRFDWRGFYSRSTSYMNSVEKLHD